MEIVCTSCLDYEGGARLRQRGAIDSAAARPWPHAAVARAPRRRQRRRALTVVNLSLPSAANYPLAIGSVTTVAWRLLISVGIQKK